MKTPIDPSLTPQQWHLQKQNEIGCHFIQQIVWTNISFLCELSHNDNKKNWKIFENSKFLMYIWKNLHKKWKKLPIFQDHRLKKNQEKGEQNIERMQQKNVQEQ